MSIGAAGFSNDVGGTYHNNYLGQQLNQMSNQANQQYNLARQVAHSIEIQPDWINRYGPPSQPITKQPEKKSMFKEITADVKGFILEHRGVIYFIAFALIFDHFIFRGAFKARLQSMAERIVAKVEEKIK